MHKSDINPFGKTVAMRLEAYLPALPVQDPSTGEVDVSSSMQRSPSGGGMHTAQTFPCPAKPGGGEPKKKAYKMVKAGPFSRTSQ